MMHRVQSDQLRRAPLVVIECDASERVERWNERAEKLFGHTAEEAMGLRLGEIIPPLDEADGWTRLLRGVGEEPETLRHKRKGGGMVVCGWSHQPSPDAPGSFCLFGQDVTRLARQIEEERVSSTLLKAIHDRLPLAVWRTDAQGVFTYHRGRGVAETGLAEGQMEGTNVFDVYPPEISASVRDALAGKACSEVIDNAHGSYWEGWVLPLRGPDGEIAGTMGFALNVTALRRAEQELQTKLELIERQQVALRELSTPVIQVWEGVLALPMVGILDSTRAAAVMDDLLEAVARTRSRFAILDLTGIDAIDTATAAYLLSLIRAIRLLGAEGIVTGIRPSVAQTIVGLGVRLEEILTLVNLQAGLRHCITRMQADAGRPAAR
ncbi:PAS domain-containing protein [Sorangium sp. So ce1128]